MRMHLGRVVVREQQDASFEQVPERLEVVRGEAQHGEEEEEAVVDDLIWVDFSDVSVGDVPVLRSGFGCEQGQNKIAV